MSYGQRKNAMVLSGDGGQPPDAGAPGKTENFTQTHPPVAFPTETTFSIAPQLSPAPVTVVVPLAESGLKPAARPQTAPTAPTAAPVPSYPNAVSPKPGRLAGVLYKSEYAAQMLEYFESFEKTKIVHDEMVWKNGEVAKKEREVPNAPPQFSEFARKIKTTHRQLKAWCRLYPEFLEAYIACQEIFKEFLISNGLLGHYASTMTIFTAKNETDMKDKSIVDHRKWDMKKVLDMLERGEDTNRLELPSGDGGENEEELYADNLN